jgi:general secretion pathway protein E
VNHAESTYINISPASVRTARELATTLDRRLMDVLEEQSDLNEDVFMQALGNSLDYPVFAMSDLDKLEPAFDLLTYTEAAEKECLLLRDPNGGLALAITDPFNAELQAWAEQKIPQNFSWKLARRVDVAAYLTRHEDTLMTMDQLVSEGDQGAIEGNDVEHLSVKSIAADTSPVVKLVHSTMYDALKSEASDIHLETGPVGLVIRYRIDGVLNTVGSVAGSELAEQVISRIKVMSELDIAERRVPQDGRFKIAVRGHEVDFRVSIMPSIFGEDAVLRVLDKKTLSGHIKGLRLDHFGFDDKSLAQIRKLSNAPYGMVLVTGPTGSGKTTTLYGAISENNLGLDKVITIEDPVEYQLPGVLQIPVNEKKGLTFVRGLRSILRHDPDKIMVGEIRDPETAQIAVQSALTGHLVFTTVHANNAFDVIGRFMHMGVDPYSFVSAMNGIIAQRLMRINCPACSVEIQPDATLLEESGLTIAEAENMHFYKGSGCGQCRGTGYKGRKAICEILLLNDSIRELIIARSPTRLVREAARKNGTRFLREIAMDAVANGETTLQEINRVTLVG